MAEPPVMRRKVKQERLVPCVISEISGFFDSNLHAGAWRFSFRMAYFHRPFGLTGKREAAPDH